MTEGWKCPGCGSCYAPFVQKCSECGPVVVENVELDLMPGKVIPVPNQPWTPYAQPYIPVVPSDVTWLKWTISCN